MNRSGATRAVALNISKAFGSVWHAVLLHKLTSYEISGRVFGLISSFPSNKQLLVVLNGKSSQEYLVNAGVAQGSILGPTLFILYINDLPDDVICNIVIYAGKTQLVLFDRSNNTGAVDVKIEGSVLEEKSSFMKSGFTFSSRLDWDSYIISVAKRASKKIGALIRSMKFLSFEVALYLYKSTILPSMEYCCHVWAGAPSLAAYLELLPDHQNVARSCLW